MFYIFWLICAGGVNPLKGARTLPYFLTINLLQELILIQ